MHNVLFGIGVTYIESKMESFWSSLRFKGFQFIKNTCMQEQIPQSIGISIV